MDEEDELSAIERKQIRKLLIEDPTIFSQDEVTAIRDVIMFAARVQWLFSTLAAIAKWLTIVSAGYLVLAQLGILGQ